MAKLANEDEYSKIKPSDESLSQQLVLLSNLVKVKSLAQWKHELADCSRAAVNQQKYYYVIVRKDLNDPKKDEIRFVEHRISDKAEDEYNKDKEKKDIRFTGHSSLVTKKEYDKHLKHKGGFNVIMAGSFVIKSKADWKQDKKNCMVGYDNDSGHFKGIRYHHRYLFANDMLIHATLFRSYEGS